MRQFLDKTMIEYRVREGNKAYIHYLLEKEGGNGEEYIKEEMRDMYEYILDCDLLIIDDLGTELNNTFVCFFICWFKLRERRKGWTGRGKQRRK